MTDTTKDYILTQEIVDQLKKEDFPTQVREIFNYYNEDPNLVKNKDLYFNNFKEILSDLKEANRKVVFDFNTKGEPKAKEEEK